MKDLPDVNRLWLLPVVYYLLFPLIVIAYWFVYAVAPEFHAEWLQDEDHLIEWLTFMGFAMAFVLLAMTFKYHRRMDRWSKAYLAAVTLFCFVCAGEEISWAQRIIGFETPESLVERNEQHEFNLHNLHFEHFHPQDAANLCMGMFGMVMPLLGARWSFRPSGAFRRYFAPFYMIPCFVLAGSMNSIHRYLKPWLAEQFGWDVYVVVRSDTRELSEMLWGLCMMLSACALYAAWERYRPASELPA